MPKTGKAGTGGICCHVLNRGNGQAVGSHDEDDNGGFVEVLPLAGVGGRVVAGSSGRLGPSREPYGLGRGACSRAVNRYAQRPIRSAAMGNAHRAPSGPGIHPPPSRPPEKEGPKRCNTSRKVSCRPETDWGEVCFPPMAE